mgnify:CR=1 FL=1
MCEKCKNLGSIYCDECVHNENLADYYEPAAVNEPENEMENARNLAISEWLDYKAPKNFIRCFNQAVAFTISEETGSFLRLNFTSVHIAEISMVATDGAILAEFYFCSPQELIGKNIVKIEGNRIALCNLKFPNPQIAFGKMGTHVIPLPQPTMGHNGYFDIARFDLEAPIMIQKHYYERIITHLTGEILFTYTPGETNEPLLFSGDNGRVIVMPVRQGGV